MVVAKYGCQIFHIVLRNIEIRIYIYIFFFASFNKCPVTYEQEYAYVMYIDIRSYKRRNDSVINIDNVSRDKKYISTARSIKIIKYFPTRTFVWQQLRMMCITHLGITYLNEKCQRTRLYDIIQIRRLPKHLEDTWTSPLFLTSLFPLRIGIFLAFHEFNFPKIRKKLSTYRWKFNIRIARFAFT